MNDFAIVDYFDVNHREQVVALWDAVFGYKEPHNRPGLAIDKKLAIDDGLLFVAVSGATVIGTVMAGYDGHRGWIYSVAVSPTHRRQNIGSRLVRFAEAALVQKGCMKINLQILEGNEPVTDFYASLGYVVEKRINMGKRIEANVPKP